MARYLTLALFFTACQVESCKSQDVGIGVARLTVRNAGAVTKLIDRDARCGFASEAVLANPKLEGTSGSLGTATWTVSNCELRFDEPTTALSTCGGVSPAPVPAGAGRGRFIFLEVTCSAACRPAPAPTT